MLNLGWWAAYLIIAGAAWGIGYRHALDVVRWRGEQKARWHVPRPAVWLVGLGFGVAVIGIVVGA